MIHVTNAKVLDATTALPRV